jgi:hypothetical protein
MSLIRAVERILGCIDNWPSQIIEYLFCEIPDLTSLENLIAFFYGNGVPCPMACQFYHACNSRATATVTEQFYITYSFWESCTYEIHLAQYYNVRLREQLYLNGTYRNPTERVPNPPPLRIGIGSTPFPTIVRTLLQGIRSSVNYY